MNEGLFDDKLNFIPPQSMQNFGNLEESMFEEQKSMMILGNYDGINNPLEQSEIYESNEFIRQLSNNNQPDNIIPQVLQKVDSKLEYEQSSPVILHQSNRQDEDEEMRFDQ